MLIIAVLYFFMAGVPWILERSLHSFLSLEPMTIIAVLVVIGALCFFGLGAVIVSLLISGVGSIITSIITFGTAIVTVTLPSIYRGLKKRLSTIGISNSVSRILSVLIIIILI